MTLRISVPLTLIALVAGSSLAGCRKGNPGRVEAEAISQCEQGVRNAAQIKDLAQASKVYYQSCAGIHAEPKCQEAWKQAANAKRDDQMALVIKGCAAAYCSTLGESKFEACRKDFQITPASVQRAWPPLHGAILNHDTGPYQARVQASLLGFYVHAAQLAAPPPSASAAPSTAPSEAGADAAISTDGGKGASAKPAASGSPAAKPTAAKPSISDKAKPEAKKPEAKKPEAKKPEPKKPAPKAAPKPTAAPTKSEPTKPTAPAAAEK